MAHRGDNSILFAHPPDPQPSTMDQEKMLRYRFQIPIFITAKKRFDHRMAEYFSKGKLHREQNFLDRMTHLAYLESCEFVHSKWSRNCGDEEEYCEMCRILLEYVQAKHGEYSRQNLANKHWSRNFRAAAKTSLFLLGGMAIGSGIGGIVGFGVSLAFLQATESASTVLGATAAAYTAGAATSKLGASAAAGSVAAKALGAAGTKVGLKIGATTGGAVTGGFISLREKLCDLFRSKKRPSKMENKKKHNETTTILHYGKRRFMEELAGQFEDNLIFGHLFGRGRLPERSQTILMELRVAETELATRDGVEEAGEVAEQ